MDDNKTTIKMTVPPTKEVEEIEVGEDHKGFVADHHLAISSDTYGEPLAQNLEFNTEPKPTDEDEKADQDIEKVIRDAMQQQYFRGLQIGALTVSKIVLDMLNDKSKPLLKRIEKVRRYCKTPLANADKVLGNIANSGNTAKGDTVENTET